MAKLPLRLAFCLNPLHALANLLALLSGYRNPL